MNDSLIIDMIMKNEKKFSTNKNGKLILYNIVLSIITSYKKVQNENIFVLNGREKNRISNYECIYYSVPNSGLIQFLKLKKHFSYIKYSDRVKAFFYAFRIKSDTKIGYLVDYFMWKAFLKNNNIKIIANNGHFDRITTQIALISQEIGIEYYMLQHGLLGDSLFVPTKIPANKVIAYDKNEVEKFKNLVVCNSNCNYDISYNCNTKFSSEHKRLKEICIIEQNVPEMKKIIEVTKSIFCNYKIDILMHPLSNVDYDIREDYIVIRRDEIKNLDYGMIISPSSTLAYDYLRNGYNNSMLILDTLKCFKNISRYYPNVIICNNFEDFKLTAKRLKEITFNKE